MHCHRTSLLLARELGEHRQGLPLRYNMILIGLGSRHGECRTAGMGFARESSGVARRRGGCG
jgi:hypothetical protein